MIMNMLPEDNNIEEYEENIDDKKFSERHKIALVRYDNASNNLIIQKLYNNFIKSFDYSNESWFIFCDNDFEIIDDISQKISFLDKTKIYGPVGFSVCKDKSGQYVKEWRGEIHERKRDGTSLRKLSTDRRLTGTSVHVVNGVCLIVHSSLIDKYKLSFDENCHSDLYAYDFCLSAFFYYGIEANIILMNCCLWSQFEEFSERHASSIKCKYFDSKHEENIKKYLFSNHDENILMLDIIGFNSTFLHDEAIIGQVYKAGSDLDIESINDSKIKIYHNVLPESTVLDVGCACGDLGVILNGNKKCQIYGMEYDKHSIELAELTKAYKDIHQVDLNNFDFDCFYKYYKKFDYIIFADVLEHILYAQEILHKFQLFLKDEGLFLISLPNIAHASIKSDLMNDKWEYADVGVLDRTHIRFFTAESISEFMAQIGLEIIKVDYTFMKKEGLQKDTSVWFNLQDVVRQKILNNPHSYVWQYIMIVKKSSNKTYKDILDENKNKISKIENVDACFKDSDLTASISYSYLKYLKYSILSKILFGKKRNYYKSKLNLMNGSLIR